MFNQSSVRHIVVDAETKTLSGKKQLISVLSRLISRTHLKMPNSPTSISAKHKLRTKTNVELFPAVVYLDATRTTQLTITVSVANTIIPVRICEFDAGSSPKNVNCEEVLDLFPLSVEISDVSVVLLNRLPEQFLVVTFDVLMVGICDDDDGTVVELALCVIFMLFLYSELLMYTSEI